MEEINKNIQAAAAALESVKQKPGSTGPRQIELLENLTVAVSRLAALVAEKLPSA